MAVLYALMTGMSVLYGLGCLLVTKRNIAMAAAERAGGCPAPVVPSGWAHCIW